MVGVRPGLLRVRPLPDLVGTDGSIWGASTTAGSWFREAGQLHGHTASRAGWISGRSFTGSGRPGRTVPLSGGSPIIPGWMADRGIWNIGRLAQHTPPTWQEGSLGALTAGFCPERRRFSRRRDPTPARWRRGADA